MTTKPAVRYYLTLSAGPVPEEVGIYLALYDEDDQLLDRHSRDWVAFCFTWQDLVEWIERKFQEAGGTLNVSLNRPSPFVDLS